VSYYNTFPFKKEMCRTAGHVILVTWYDLKQNGDGRLRQKCGQSCNMQRMSGTLQGTTAQAAALFPQFLSSMSYAASACSGAGERCKLDQCKFVKHVSCELLN
jgi:hypothetical protein